MTGDEDHRHMGQCGVGLQRLEDLEAAHARHFGVEQYQIGCRFACEAQRIFPVAGKSQVARAFQDASK